VVWRGTDPRSTNSHVPKAVPQVCHIPYYLLNVFRHFYLYSDDSVNGLLSVVEGRTVGDYASLEQLIMLLSKAGHITPSLLNQLWDIFAMKVI